MSYCLVPCQSSDLLSADGVVSNRQCVLHAVTIIPAAADSTLTLYDHASAASGKVLAKVFVKASTASQTIQIPGGCEAVNGIYADIDGASAGFVVYFHKL